MARYRSTFLLNSQSIENISTFYARRRASTAWARSRLPKFWRWKEERLHFVNGSTYKDTLNMEQDKSVLRRERGLKDKYLAKLSWKKFTNEEVKTDSCVPDYVDYARFCVLRWRIAQFHKAEIFLLAEHCTAFGIEILLSTYKFWF
jgi:hypothetical protein